jgi:hypothetical protein
MNETHQPGTLAPLVPNMPGARKSKKGLWIGLGIGAILLCCIATLAVVWIERNQIPQVASLFATKTPTQTPTPTVTATPTATLTPTPRPGARITGRAYYTDTGQAFSTTVSLTNTGTQAELTAETDSQGYYEFTGVEPGQYRIMILIPEELITACSNPRLTSRDEWSVGYQITATGGMFPMVDSNDFSVSLGDNIVKTPPIVCQ